VKAILAKSRSGNAIWAIFGIWFSVFGSFQLEDSLDGWLYVLVVTETALNPKDRVAEENGNGK